MEIYLIRHPRPRAFELEERIGEGVRTEVVL